ncbi:hypothetical protein [Nocardia pseudovaccinii]|uniref:hypothetical protein n=1 Tax=Nocardia pseudovaccinii TaxID=189540 RepID=UPI0007A4BA17|nr:hypothetical protein [Nocardia pseudovaccinii]
MTAEQWCPAEGDVHLRIWLSDGFFDYVASARAVRNLIHDWNRRNWYTIELVRDITDDVRQLPRLPGERLFLGP